MQLVMWLIKGGKWLLEAIGNKGVDEIIDYFLRRLRKEEVLVKQTESANEICEKKSLFSERFILLQELLNGARIYNDNEYTLEYISSLIGIKNAGEMRAYIETTQEPDEDIKQRLVEVFGVNRNWMLFNQGDHPFASNIRQYMTGARFFGNDPMDILRYEKLSAVRHFIFVIGKFEHRRMALIIRQTTDFCYEVYPKMYNLDAQVGASGRHQLVELYRFLRETARIRKLYGIVYEATEKQFIELYLGDVAPMKVRQYTPFRGFEEDFLDLSDFGFERVENIWDENLISVKKMIRNDIKRIDEINLAWDRDCILSTLVEA